MPTDRVLVSTPGETLPSNTSLRRYHDIAYGWSACGSVGTGFFTDRKTAEILGCSPCLRCWPRRKSDGTD